MVLDGNLGGHVEPPTSVQDAAGVLVVLIANHPLVEQADAFENLAAPAAELNCIDGAILSPVAEAGTGAKGTARADGDGAADQPLLRRYEGDAPANHVGTSGLQRPHKDLGVARRIDAVRVDAHDDLAPRGANPNVERDGGQTAWVVEKAHSWISSGNLLDDSASAILGNAVDDQHFHLGGVERAGEE